MPIQEYVTQLREQYRIRFKKWQSLYHTMKEKEIYKYKRVGQGDAYFLLVLKVTQLTLFPDSGTLYFFFVLVFAWTKMHPIGIFLRILVFMYVWSTQLFRYFIAFCLTVENYVVKTWSTQFFFEILLISCGLLGDQSVLLLRTGISTVCYSLIALFMVYIRIRSQFINYRFLELEMQTPLSWDLIEDYMIRDLNRFQMPTTKIDFPWMLGKHYPFISGFGYLSKQNSTLPEPKPRGKFENPEHKNLQFINPYYVSSLVTAMILGILLFYKFIIVYAGDYSTATLGLEHTLHLLDTISSDNVVMIEKLQETAAHFRRLQKKTPSFCVPLIEFLQTKRLRTELFSHIS